MSLKKLFKILAIQLGVAILLVFAYLAYDADVIYEWLSGDVKFGTPAQECDLHAGACTATMGDGTPVTFAMSPRPIPVMQKLQLHLATEGRYDTLKVEIYGLNMNMGRYNYTLTRTSDGNYSGEGMIPACSGRMDWRANIIAEEPTRRIGTYFTFSTE
ncbi:hypothetical protein WCX18_09355 [Sulfurimonas sp. HSL1-2]|uniref:hypothetical protein n=1 Tax=Thiomicrolovo zhangzhouensis TaxID=3131933 RepID=UPI0031F9331C